ncbi:MAG TPA: pirin family protein [Acetobacteraceae bacterium]|nr:pirin family protein [Acetobacteraceae bacterium]
MIEIRPFASIGSFRNAWLNAHHHFSFGSYHDPSRMGWGALRVWNDDEISPNSGFAPHSHQNMEIVTFVRQGAVTHQDDLGNEGVTRAGDVQVMHAGTGITHAEYNREAEATRLFQIWILPDKAGVAPGWGTREFPKTEGEGFTVMASGHEADQQAGALPLHADARVLAARLGPGQRIAYAPEEGRALYMVPATGGVTVNGKAAAARDGVAITGERELLVEAGDSPAELVLVDVRA